MRKGKTPRRDRDRNPRRAAAAAPSLDAPPPKSPRRRALERWLSLAVVLVVTAVGATLRVTAAKPDVFPAPGEVRLFDTDPYYHVRHARYAAEHFPHLLRWDPGIYPAGTPGLYVGLFDLSIAGASLVAGGGHTDPALVEKVAAWTPPAIGALCVLALFWLGVITIGPVGGALATVFLFLDPGLFANRTLLGYPDHHVAEVLLGLLTAAGLVRAVQRTRAERAPPLWLPAVVEALPLALFFLTWLGAPIYLVLVAVTLWLVQTVDIARGAGGDVIGRAALRYGLGLIVVLVPVALLVPWLIMDPHIFKQATVAMVLVAGGLPLYGRLLGEATRRGVRPLVAALGGVGLVVAGLVVLALVAPEGRLLAQELLGVKTTLVREQAAIDLKNYLYLGGTPAVLAVLAVPLAIAQAARGRDGRSALVAVVLGGLVVALWLRTHDYGYAAPGYQSLLAAYLVVEAAAVLRRRWTRVAAAAALAVAVVVPIWPAGAVVPPQRGPDKLKGLMIIDEGWVHALRWVRDHTPPPVVGPAAPIPDDPSFRHPPGDYAVLAFWDFGHYIAAIAERLPLASGGISNQLARWFLVEDEEEAVRPETAGLLPGERVGYVMVDARTAGDFFMAGLQMAGRELKDYREAGKVVQAGGAELKLWTFAGHYPKTIVSRLYRDAGNGLAHFRLVYETPERSASFFTARRDAAGGTGVTRRSLVLANPMAEAEWRNLERLKRVTPAGEGVVYDASVAPTVRVFEVVRGAALDGYAEPGATVEAALELRAAAGKEALHYARSAQADAQGHYVIVVPYPTDAAAPDTDVVATGPYALSSGGKLLARVPVPAAAVRSGARVAVAGP